MKDVDLGDPTSFLDHVYLGCTLRECQISKDVVDSCKSMFESRTSAGAMEKLPGTKAKVKLDAETISSWSYDMEGHAKKCVERNYELAKKTTQHMYKVATPCTVDHQFREEEIGLSRGRLAYIRENRRVPPRNLMYCRTPREATTSSGRCGPGVGSPTSPVLPRTPAGKATSLGR